MYPLHQEKKERGQWGSGGYSKYPVTCSLFFNFLFHRPENLAIPGLVLRMFVPSAMLTWCKLV
eukprot:1154880-Pelagomonas_calceolata.AAC.1